MLFFHYMLPCVFLEAIVFCRPGVLLVFACALPRVMHMRESRDHLFLTPKGACTYENEV